MDERGARDSPSRPGHASRSGSLRPGLPPRRAGIGPASNLNRARRRGAPPPLPPLAGAAEEARSGSDGSGAAAGRAGNAGCGDAMDVPAARTGGGGGDAKDAAGRRERASADGASTACFEEEAPSALMMGSRRRARLSVRTADGKLASHEDEAPSAAMLAREDGRRRAHAGLDREMQSM